MAPGLFGAAFHHDHAASHGQKSTCWGQNLVPLGVIPEPLGATSARARLCDFELWVSLKRSVESGHATLPYETKAGLLALMLQRQREQLEKDAERLVLVDSLYAKAPWLNAARGDAKTHLLGRLARNRVVFKPPPERPPGKRGAARQYGEKVDWKQDFERHAQWVQLRLYGRRVRARVWTMTGRVRKHHQDVRLVASQLEGASKTTVLGHTLSPPRSTLPYASCYPRPSA